MIVSTSAMPAFAGSPGVGYFVKIRFYREIFEVNLSRAASTEKFKRRLPKQSLKRGGVAI